MTRLFPAALVLVFAAWAARAVALRADLAVSRAAVLVWLLAQACSSVVKNAAWAWTGSAGSWGYEVAHALVTVMLLVAAMSVGLLSNPVNFRPLVGGLLFGLPIGLALDAWMRRVFWDHSQTPSLELLPLQVALYSAAGIMAGACARREGDPVAAALAMYWLALGAWRGLYLAGWLLGVEAVRDVEAWLPTAMTVMVFGWIGRQARPRELATADLGAQR